MNQTTPDDVLIRRIMAWWGLALKIGTGLLGLAVAANSTLFQHPVDPTGASIGALLIGVPLTSVIENVWNSRGGVEPKA